MCKYPTLKKKQRKLGSLFRSLIFFISRTLILLFFFRSPIQPILRKSQSIPVHLTVSLAESHALPYNLRPEPFCRPPLDHGSSSRSHHEERCERRRATKTVRLCPRAASYERPSALQQQQQQGRKKMTWTSSGTLSRGGGASERTVASSPAHRKQQQASPAPSGAVAYGR